MIRDARAEDQNTFISMAQDFYSSGAVMHSVNSTNFEKTFAAAMGKSPFLRILIIEDNAKNTAGYALLSFTYSNEAGGEAVITEELYVRPQHRGNGYGSAFLRFIEQEYPAAARFRLEAAKGNQKAIELYRRLGYNFLDYVQLVKDR